MNENTSNHDSLENSANDELLARVASADPATTFDAGTLSATLVDDAIAHASSAASTPQSAAGRVASQIASRFADAYRTRPRFVLGSSLSAVAAVAAIAVFGSMSLGTLGGSQRTLFTVAGPNEGQAPAQSDSKIAANSIASGGGMAAMLPAFTYNYLAGSSLSSDTGSEHIYSLEPLADPAGFLQNIADYLGITQKVHKGIYADFTTALDETKPFDLTPGKPQLTLSTTGSGGWWLEIPNLNIYGCAISSDAGKIEPQPCPVVVASKPSIDDAKTQFIKLFAQTGFSFEAGDIQVSKNDAGITSAYGQANLATRKGNAFSDLGFSMTWSSDGTLVAANGLASKLVDQGSFETISEVDAIARANDPKWQFFGGYGMLVDGVAKGAPVAGYGSIEGGAAAGSSSSASAPAPIALPTATPGPVASYVAGDAPTAMPDPDVTAEPVPLPTEGGALVDPMPIPNETFLLPTPEVKDIVIDHLELSWMQISDAKGKVWLVPAYQLFSGANAYARVPAMADGIIGF